MPLAVTGNETYYDKASDTTYTYDANGQLTSYPGQPESAVSSSFSQNLPLISLGVGLAALFVGMGAK